LRALRKRKPQETQALALASSQSWLPLLRPSIPVGWRLRLLREIFKLHVFAIVGRILTIETVPLKLARKLWAGPDHLNPDQTYFPDDYLHHVLYITRIYFIYGTTQSELIGLLLTMTFSFFFYRFFLIFFHSFI